MKPCDASWGIGGCASTEEKYLTLFNGGYAERTNQVIGQRSGTPNSVREPLRTYILVALIDEIPDSDVQTASPRSADKQVARSVMNPVLVTVFDKDATYTKHKTAHTLPEITTSAAAQNIDIIYAQKHRLYHKHLELK